MRLSATTLSLWLFTGLLVSGFTTTRADTPARFIVKWKDAQPGTRREALLQANDSLRQQVGFTLRHRRMLEARLEVLEADTDTFGRNTGITLEQLRRDPRVEYAVEDKRRFAHALTNDPLITASSNHPNGQWYVNKLETSAINAIDAWDTSQGGSAGSGVIVAVLDTGIRADHPDLVGKVLPGFDFVDCDNPDSITGNCTGVGHTFFTANDGNGWDTNPADPGDWIDSTDKQNNFFSQCDIANSSWHGIRVAGIIGAATNNNVGMAGVGYNARILPLRVLGKCGGYDSDIIAAMKWAAGMAVTGATPTINPNPAKVINLSLGSADACSAAYQDAINQILARGVSIVASAGNEGGPLDTPANCAGVISVVGVRNAGSKVGYSSLGSGATIAAPAGNCVNDTSLGLPCLYSIDTLTNLGMTSPGVHAYTDATNFNLGTSFSAPIVSGTIALMLGNNNALTPAAIRARLQASAKAFPALTGVTACHVPQSSGDVQNSECNCTRATCGAGLTDAHAAVLAATQAITPYIRGATAAGTNRSIVLDAAGSTLTDNTATYSWSITSGNATLSSTQSANITVTAPTAGSVTLSLHIDDGNTHSADLTHSLTVFGPPTALITGNNTITAGQSMTLDASASSAQDGGPLGYAWSVVGNKATLSANNAASVTLTAPTTSGTITVHLIVTDQQGNTATQDLNVVVTGGVIGSNNTSGGSSTSSGGGGVLDIGDIGLLLMLAMAGWRRRYYLSSC